MSSRHIFYISFFSCALLLHTAFTYNINSSLEYCGYLSQRVFKQRCIGLYTATMLAKYMDGKMRHLNQFAVYAAEDDPRIYFLALHYCVDLVQLCEVENHRKPVLPEIKENAILYAMRSILAEAGAAFIQPFTKLQLLVIFALVYCAYKSIGNI
uniref:Uncharacterized protein n=1 Tax=Bactrocera latifrons TaxID=174628 RepID=A0A0K8W2K6_BACLA